MSIPLCGASVNSTAFAAESAALDVTPKVSASLSFVGSCVVVFRFARTPLTMRSTYQRIMSAMCITNAIGCMGYAIGTASFDDPRLCAWQGFDVHVVVGIVACYSACLATTLLLQVILERPATRVRQIEPVYHVVSISVPLSVGFVCLGLSLFGPAGLWCWIKSEYVWARLAFLYVPLWSIMLYVGVVLVAMLWKSNASHRRMRTHLAFGRSRRARGLQEVGMQTSLYFLAFELTWIFGTAVRIQNAVYPDCQVFGLIWLQSLFVPLQGFFVFLVYMLPRLKKCVRLRYSQASLPAAYEHHAAPNCLLTGLRATALLLFGSEDSLEKHYGCRPGRVAQSGFTTSRPLLTMPNMTPRRVDPGPKDADGAAAVGSSESNSEARERPPNPTVEATQGVALV